MWGYILKRVRILIYIAMFIALYHYPYMDLKAVAFGALVFFIWSDLVELIDDTSDIKRALKAKETEIWNSLLTKRKHF